MITVSQQLASQRWDIITPPLREALFSDMNADFVWNLCQSEHLTEEKSYQVAELSGYVLLGFLHPEDLAGEIVSSVDLPAPLAKTISDQINSRVFAPLRADIDKVYSPISKIGGGITKSTPKIIQDIESSSPQRTVPQNITPPPQKPVTFSDVGWSKQPATQSNIVVKLVTPTPIPSPVPKPAVAAAEPAPMMLHEDTTFKPAEKNIGFTLTKPHGGAEMNLSKGPAAATTRPAVLEFGGASSGDMSVPKPSMPGQSSVRPMGFGSSFPSAPTTNTGSRNVSQIVLTMSTPVPKPPTPPMPPRPPQVSSTPPSTSVPQPDKLIVKDFL
jgi:hypothetical protein